VRDRRWEEYLKRDAGKGDGAAPGAGRPGGPARTPRAPGFWRSGMREIG